MTNEDLLNVRPSSRPVLVALASIVLFWLVQIAAEIGYYGPGGEIDVWGVQSALAQSAVIVIGLIVGLALVGRVDLAPRGITLVFLVGCFLNLVVWIYVLRGGSFASPEAWRAIQTLILLPQLALLVSLLRAAPGRWVLSGLVVSAVFLGAQEVVARYFPVDGLYYFADETEGDYIPVDVEALYAAQDGLMSRQVDGLASGDPGKPDVFALLLGGTSYQSVFLSEVEGVASVLESSYGSGDRTIALANSSADPLRYPMANRANLSRALIEIGNRQGPEDVAFLFLTSHGQEDNLSLAFYEAGTTDLSAAEFADMLDESRIGPAVIVVSACHSGSFIDDIAAPDRLVITASRTDRTSFGCSDGAEWTEFGRSFFDLALRADPDPRNAFAAAAKDVERKEQLDGLPQSEPQISEGARIGGVLDRLLASRTTTSD